MKINSMKIKNFRNLDGVQISFHPDANYIIGENNIGKSNLLFLMNILFSGKGFDENDFINTDNPIEVELSLKLVNEEIGFFKDYFSPTDPCLVNLKIEQRTDDVYPSMYHIESGDALPYKLIKKVRHHQHVW
ncbi:AAA family ATPase [Fibrobacter sp. HC4]|uniref:AAA family ATPase n=1 Tax=Fibrobacter sp. HC4 TaxID=3239812 RepID=UPI002019CB35|nr:AAA family ATPase [Fibrobacter succinogenes]MCL4103355.1 DNA replication and repair protein RecF [Fibrobacter succinogenes]